VSARSDSDDPTPVTYGIPLGLGVRGHVLGLGRRRTRPRSGTADYSGRSYPCLVGEPVARPDLHSVRRRVPIYARGRRVPRDSSDRRRVRRADPTLVAGAHAVVDLQLPPICEVGLGHVQAAPRPRRQPGWLADRQQSAARPRAAISHSLSETPTHALTRDRVPGGGGLDCSTQDTRDRRDLDDRAVDKHPQLLA